MRGIDEDGHSPLFLVLAIAVLVVGSFFIVLDGGTEQESITGKVATRLFVVSTYEMTCNTTLYAGYNLYSLQCVPSNASPQFVFADYMTNITSLHSYDASAASDPWAAFNPSLPSWVVQDLDALDRKSGYWIKMRQNTSISINGTYTSPVRTDLVPGWNLAGYAIKNATNVSEQLIGIDGSVSLILGYNATDQADPWKTYDPLVDPAFNDLVYFQPHHGYWLNITENATWYQDE